MIRVTTLEKWSDYSEYFIGGVSLILATALAFIYNITLSETASDYGTLFYIMMMGYPVLCLLRLSALKFLPVLRNVIAWTSPTFDILYLTAFSYFLSVHFGTAAAAFKSPAFLIYFVLVALHALRLRPFQTLYMGGLTTLLWMTLLSVLTTGGLNFDVSFIDNAVSEFISTKTEVMKLCGFLVFTVLIYLTTRRTKNLLNATQDVQELEKTLSQAHRAVQMKTDVLGHVSHDMRGPIGGVINMSDALRRTNLTNQQARYVSAIEESSQAILDAVETMLNITDVDAPSSTNKKSPEPANDVQSAQEFHLRPLVENIVERFGARARAKNLELLLHDETNRDFMIGASPQQLIKVLSNILDNAVKFTEQGQIIVTLNCETTKSGNGTLSISVDDTGKGIEPTYLDQLKERLLGKVQFSASHGMGLVIAQMFLQSKASELEIASELGEGTKVSFDLDLPVKAYKLSLPALDIPHKPLPTLRVLVVDDQERSLDILTQQVEKLNITPNKAETANAACAAINEAFAENKAYDVVILDYDMAEIDGLKLAQTIRSQDKLNDMNLLVTLKTDDRQVESQFASLHGTHLIKKPLRLESLRQAIVQAVSKENIPA